MSECLNRGQTNRTSVEGMRNRSRITAIVSVVLSIALLSIFQVSLASDSSYSPTAWTECRPGNAEAHAAFWNDTRQVEAWVKEEEDSQTEEENEPKHRWKEVWGSGHAAAEATADDRLSACETASDLLPEDPIDVPPLLGVGVPEEILEDRTYNGSLLNETTRDVFWFVGTLENATSTISFNLSSSDGIINFEYGNMTDEEAPPASDLETTGANISVEFYQDSEGQNVGTLTATSGGGG